MFVPRATLAPPDGAEPLNVMVTVALDPALTLAGTIVTDCRVGVATQMIGGIVTVAALELVVPATFFAWTK